MGSSRTCSSSSPGDSPQAAELMHNKVMLVVVAVAITPGSFYFELPNKLPWVGEAGKQAPLIPAPELITCSLFRTWKRSRVKVSRTLASQKPGTNAALLAIIHIDALLYDHDPYSHCRHQRVYHMPGHCQTKRRGLINRHPALGQSRTCLGQGRLVSCLQSPSVAASPTFQGPVNVQGGGGGGGGGIWTLLHEQSPARLHHRMES